MTNEQKQLILDLEQAIRLTRTAFNNCYTPSIKDMYLESIKGYEERLKDAKNNDKD